MTKQPATGPGRISRHFHAAWEAHQPLEKFLQAAMVSCVRRSPAAAAVSASTSKRCRDWTLQQG
eukprot:265597-Chlamydomonas_euryale.AAC.3